MIKYSNILNQKITINETDRIVKTEDGVTYTRSEMQAITGLHPDEIRGIHRIKKFFNGKILPDQKYNLITAQEMLWLIDMNR